MSTECASLFKINLCCQNMICNLNPKQSLGWPALSEEPAGLNTMTAPGGYVTMTSPKISNKTRDVYMTPLLEINSAIYENLHTTISKEQILWDISTKANSTDCKFLTPSKAPIFLVSCLLIFLQVLGHQVSSVRSIVMVAWNSC